MKRRLCLVASLLMLVVAGKLVAQSTTTWTSQNHNTNWSDALNWNNGVPNNTTDAIIPTSPSGGNIFPIVNIASVDCKTLNINTAASVSIPSGKILNIYGNLINNGTSNFGLGDVVFSGSSSQSVSGTNVFNNLKINNISGVVLSGNTTISGILKLTSGTLTTNNLLTLASTASQTAIISGSGSGSTSGNVKINRFLGIGGYHYISTPLTSNTYTEISRNINIVGFGKTYKTGGSSNVWKYNETDISQIDHPNGVRMNGWEAPSNINETMNRMQGIAVYTGNNLTLDFIGTPNNGPVSIPVTNTSSLSAGGDSNDDGWNLVGNPYPCSINWDAASGWTKSKVDNAIYMYTPSGSNGGEYMSYVNGIGNPSSVTGLIAPMQGFFIHANGNGTLGMNNSVRVDNTNTSFNKKSEDKQLIKIAVNNTLTPSLSDETTIYFDNNATANFDSDYDAYKMMNEDLLPNIYTRSTDNLNLSINGMSTPDNNETSVPLVLKVKQDGDYTISISEFSNIPAETIVYIIDTEKSISQNLNENPEYRISLTANNNNIKFYLKFAKKTAGIEKQSDNNLFYTYLDGKTLNLVYNNSSNSSATLNIYNLLGQQAVNTKKNY